MKFKENDASPTVVKQVGSEYEGIRVGYEVELRRDDQDGVVFAYRAHVIDINEEKLKVKIFSAYSSKDQIADLSYLGTIQEVTKKNIFSVTKED